MGSYLLSKGSKAWTPVGYVVYNGFIQRYYKMCKDSESGARSTADDISAA